MAPKVFIDGHAGTIGLRIRELLQGRSDLEILDIAEAHRKDAAAKRELLSRCDIAILCLPDEAALETVAAIESDEVRVIDGSTAHRVAAGWTYGLPELAPEQRAAIRSSKRVSNPGCWPTCVTLLVRPLVEAGLLPATSGLSVHGLSGYSGGGKPLIEKWENPANGLSALPYGAPYSLERKHKHVPEMMRYGGLSLEPCFVPAVGPFRCGMRIEIPLHVSQLPVGTSGAAIHEAYRARYANERFVRVHPLPGASSHAPDEHTFDPRACNGTNRVELHVVPHPSGNVLLVAVLDNLGKGASGAAVQSLNLMLGIDEATGL